MGIINHTPKGLKEESNLKSMFVVSKNSPSMLYWTASVIFLIVLKTKAINCKLNKKKKKQKILFEKGRRKLQLEMVYKNNNILQ